MYNRVGDKNNNKNEKNKNNIYSSIEDIVTLLLAAFVMHRVEDIQYIL